MESYRQRETSHTRENKNHFDHQSIKKENCNIFTDILAKLVVIQVKYIAVCYWLLKYWCPNSK